MFTENPTILMFCFNVQERIYGYNGAAQNVCVVFIHSETAMMYRNTHINVDQPPWKSFQIVLFIIYIVYLPKLRFKNCSTMY